MIKEPSLAIRQAFKAEMKLLSEADRKFAVMDVVWKVTTKLDGLAYLIGTSDEAGDSATAICWMLEDIAKEVESIQKIAYPEIKEIDEP